MEEPVYDLNKKLTIDDTTRATYQDDVMSDDIFATVLAAEAATTSTVSVPVVDSTDYTTDKPHILLDTKPLMKVLSQIAPIMVIGQRSQRAVSRGITLKINEESGTKQIEVVSPNEIYYFKALLDGTTTFEDKQHIYLEYTFLQKMAKFIPPKLLIYKDTNAQGVDIYYIRLLTGDLELVNTQLIDADYQRLTSDHEVLDIIQELEPSALLGTLNVMSKVVNFESDGNRKIMSVNDKVATFKSPLVMAGAETELLDVVLKANDINYMIKTIQLLSEGEKLKIKATDSKQLTRYAICTDNSVMITNYSDPQVDSRLRDMLLNQPTYTEIDYSALKYKLDYANSITYSVGVIEFTVENNSLKGGIKLSNGNFSNVDINATSTLLIPEGTKFKLNTKTFLSCMNALSTSDSTSIGFRDGLFYIKNSYVTLILITI